MINHVVSINTELTLFNLKKSLGISFLPVTFILFISTNIDQFLNAKIESILRSQDVFPNILWLWIVLSIMSSFLFPLLTTIIASYNISQTIKHITLNSYKPRSLIFFIDDVFEKSLLESMRAFGLACLWGLLFIIPGLVKYSYYLLTPFVVFFSQKYRLGEVDALEMSKKISQAFWWKLNGLILIFVIIIPAFLSITFDEYTNFKSHFLAATGFVAITALINIVFHYLLLKKFFIYLAKEENIEINNNETSTATNPILT